MLNFNIRLIFMITIFVSCNNDPSIKESNIQDFIFNCEKELIKAEYSVEPERDTLVNNGRYHSLKGSITCPGFKLKVFAQYGMEERDFSKRDRYDIIGVEYYNKKYILDEPKSNAGGYGFISDISIGDDYIIWHSFDATTSLFGDEERCKFDLVTNKIYCITVPVKYLRFQ